VDEVRKQGCEGVTDLPEGFKMTELGPLPEEWEVIRLGDGARFETGKRERGGAQSQGEVFSVGGEHITEDGRLDFSSLKFISRRFYEKLNSGKVKPGDTLVCKDGARTGKSAFIREIPSSGLAVNEHVFIVRPVNAQLYDEFLGYWFLSEQAWQQLRVACHGLIGGITREDISNFILPLPPPLRTAGYRPRATHGAAGKRSHGASHPGHAGAEEKLNALSLYLWSCVC